MVPGHARSGLMSCCVFVFLCVAYHTDHTDVISGMLVLGHRLDSLFPSTIAMRIAQTVNVYVTYLANPA